MDDTAKYLIHAGITADGVVERSDVVGAIFGQTEGLLGDELDLRELQQSSKVGRIDVQIASENGRSVGQVTISTSLDKVETAILAASLETITRVGPCQASIEITDIEDVREAKRREVVERAKELLAGSFEDSIMTSTEILEEVREAVRVEDITEYDGLPAGPHVADADAVIVVEGRADVLTLLKYGVKNAIAVEGTNVPDVVADLTQDRTVTAFLDGDRGGELILRELAQVGSVDYVSFAPDGQSVEDLGRHEVMRALREKVPLESLPPDDLRGVSGGEAPDPRAGSQAGTDPAAAEHDGEAVDVESSDDDATNGVVEADASDDVRPVPDDHSTDRADRSAGTAEDESVGDGPPGEESVGGDTDATDRSAVGDEVSRESGVRGVDAGSDVDADAESDVDADAESDVDADAESEDTEEPDPTPTLRDHVREVVADGSGTVRVLDASFSVLADRPASEAFEALDDAEGDPYAVVVDGEATQRLVDVASERGVEHVVARTTGEFVKQPVDVRVRTDAQLALH